MCVLFFLILMLRHLRCVITWMAINLLILFIYLFSKRGTKSKVFFIMSFLLYFIM